MALIPLKQTVTVTRAGVSDGWGGTTPGTTSTPRCRVEEKTEVVTNQVGEEAVTSVKITFDKLADICYNDDIEYVDELGRSVKRKPVNIAPVRMINGKTALTIVYL